MSRFILIFAFLAASLRFQSFDIVTIIEGNGINPKSTLYVPQKSSQKNNAIFCFW
jgi:hypothetical protein